MTRYHNKGTLLVPAARRDQVNTALERHGYGPDNFSIPMSRGGVTVYYASSWAMDDVTLSIVLEAMGAGGEYHRDKKPTVVAQEKELSLPRRAPGV